MKKVQYESRIKVYFAPGPVEFQKVPPKYVLLYPEGRHDDFGLNSVFKFFYIVNGKESYSGWLKLGFLDKDINPHSFFKKHVPRLMPLSKEHPVLFTLQPEIQCYRSMIKKLGLVDTKSLLLALHDVVALKKFEPRTEWLRAAQDSLAFKNSLSRNAQAFFAFVNAGSVLDGVEHEEFSAISEQFEINYYSDAFNSEFRVPVRYNFKSVLPSRIVALIGKNGVGKSQTLRNIVESLTKGDDRVRLTTRERAVFNRLIAIGTAGETENTFPRPRKHSRITYKLISSRRNKKSDQLDGLSGLIVNLLRTKESIGKWSRFELFLDSISSVIPLDQVGLPLRPEEQDDPPVALADLTSINESGLLDLSGRVDPTADPIFLNEDAALPLSSGQLSFLRLAAQLCGHVENGSLILLDEPETHLHPNLVTDLVAIISRVLDLTGSVCVIATHSSYFVREIPRKQVLVFRRNEDGAIEISNPRLKTFGSNVGEISFSIFEDNNFGHLLERTKALLGPNGRISKIQKEELLRELPSEALMYLENELNIRLQTDR